MPVVTVDSGVQSQVNKKADLTAKLAGDLALATVDLFTNDVTPTPQSVIGDFEIATFAGYTNQVVMGWDAIRTPLDGSVSSSATNVMTWVGPGDASGQTVRGYIVRSAGMGTPYLYGVRFPAPVPLATALDVLALVVTYREP